MILVLHNIRSLHNVGSIFRTADAVGIKKIYLAGITPSPIDRFGNPRQQVSKVSLGAEKYILWSKKYSTIRLLKELKRDGYKIFAIEQSGNSIPYYQVKLRAEILGKLVLIIGNEVEGLPKKVLKLADKILEIPMYGRKESLNVAVAFGIVAFHLIHPT